MIKDIRISAVLNGFEVIVGCQMVVFTDITEMLKEIRRYLKNPEAIEKEYLEKALNAKHMMSGIVPGTQYYPPPMLMPSSSGSGCSTTYTNGNQWISNTSGATNV